MNIIVGNFSRTYFVRRKKGKIWTPGPSAPYGGPRGIPGSRDGNMGQPRLGVNFLEIFGSAQNGQNL